MQEILPPGVKHGEKADLRTQVLGVSGNGAHRRAHRPEQNVVDVLFILVGDRSDWLWHRKDDVEVADVEKLRSTVFQPFGASQRLALAAVAVSATNGELTICCLMGKNLNGELVSDLAADVLRFDEFSWSSRVFYSPLDRSLRTLSLISASRANDRRT